MITFSVVTLESPYSEKSDGTSARAAPRTRHPLLGKTALALVVMLGALAIPYASPRLRALRVVAAPWDGSSQTEDTSAQGSFTPAQSLTVGSQPLAAAANEGTVTNALPEAAQKKEELDPAVLAKLQGSLAVEDPVLSDGSHALDAFYAQLAKTIRARTALDVDPVTDPVTHICHYGDSVIASDLISGTMRRRMQEKYGDAGHGFILIADPWGWYFHNDVTRSNTAGWDAAQLKGPIAPDGLYGLGGVSFQPTGGGIAFFGTASKGAYGRKVSRFDVYYLEQPNGGDIEVKVGDGPATRFPTRGEAKASRIHSVKVPDGEAVMRIRSGGGGGVRLFGVSLERDAPGVTYDALGAHAAMAVYWKQMDEQHWTDQMALRKPALIVLQYGTNESELWKIDWDEYEKNLRMIFDKVREAAPKASILVMAPMDRAERGAGGALQTKPVILKLREVQHRVATAKSLAYWDTFAAMGGEGSMARWYTADPQLCGGDLTHPTPAGGEVIGGLFSKALMTGYEAYASKHEGAPPPPP